MVPPGRPLPQTAPQPPTIHGVSSLHLPPSPHPALFPFLASQAHSFCQTPSSQSLVIPPLGPQGLQLASQRLERKVTPRLQSLTGGPPVPEQPNTTVYLSLAAGPPHSTKGLTPSSFTDFTASSSLSLKAKGTIRGSHSQNQGWGREMGATGTR